MSGGSWDYLYSAENLLQRKEDIKDMGEYLIKLGFKEVGERLYPICPKCWRVATKVGQLIIGSNNIVDLVIK